jgi:hypothetical protein
LGRKTIFENYFALHEGRIKGGENKNIRPGEEVSVKRNREDVGGQPS